MESDGRRVPALSVGDQSAARRVVLLLSSDLELDALAEVFVGRGFRAERQPDLHVGLARVFDGDPTLVLLDVALLHGNGVSVLRRIRGRSQVPLIMVAAEMDRAEQLSSLEAGADDYWVKPLDSDEVLARTQTLLRRSGPTPLLTPAGRIDLSGVVVEPAGRLVSVDGEVMDVTSLEFDVLEYLIRAAGRIVSRDELMAVVVQREASPLDRALDVHISRLRKKLGGRRTLIRTIRGVGYVVCP